MRAKNVTVSISLPFEVVEMVEEVMEREKMSRSNAVAYLIRMGYVYRYKVLPATIGEVGKDGQGDFVKVGD
jgi:metal-responsive CopG/Arc/MetJ family transcriptional regulator